MTYYRSIQFKILGVAIGLLAAMAVASIWSSQSTDRVNRQLATFAEAVLPFALAAKDLRVAIIVEEGAIERREPGLCGAPFQDRSRRIQQQLATMEAVRVRGAGMAVLELNKLKFSELAPIVSSLRESHVQLIDDVGRLCAAAPDSEAAHIAAGLAADRAAGLERHADRLSANISTFTRTIVEVVETNERQALRATQILILVSALVGLYLASFIARGLTRPIERLRVGALAVQSGELDNEVPVTTADEIGEVTRAFNAMIGELRVKEEIKATFGQYIDPRIVATLITGDARRSTAGQKQPVTIFFSDLVGFTPIADRLTASGLVKLMNAYFTTMSEAIRAEQGIIDKYIGDAVMAFWTAPFVPTELQAEAACRAALAQFDRLAIFRAQLPELMGMRQNLPPIDIRIGLASGDAIVGSIGSDSARNFTVMGDVAIAGSRLEGANKYYGTRILIDQATRDQAGPAIVAREVDRIVLKGRSEAGSVFELRAMADTAAPSDLALVELYAAALAAYARGDWAAARAGFAECLALAPDDGPAQALAARVERLAADPPARWDGIWRLDAK